MKKLLLSLAAVFLFSIYSFHEKGEADEIKITPPISQSQNSSATKYNDGEYAGNVADAFYGNIQVKAIINNGRLSDVQFLEFPNDRDTSIMINTQAMPLLTQEAIQAQNANVDIISGATDTSKAFVESLNNALSKAIN